MKGRYIAALDQGTTSTRCILFDHDGRIVRVSQLEHRQFYPKPGQVEHDALEIWQNSRKVLLDICTAVGPQEIQAIGITNQRETVLIWDRDSGKPFYRALVWQDTRTEEHVRRLTEQKGVDFFRQKSGLPPSTYFSASKLAWLLNSDPEYRRCAQQGRLLAGTIDSWLLWKLSGGEIHVSDVSNASRTQLMNIGGLCWDRDLLSLFDIPDGILPRIRPSIPAEPYTWTTLDGALDVAIPVCGILGDQQAALFGQACFEPGMCKNTYGTGCFALMPIGENVVHSSKGLLTTVAWMQEDAPVQYAFEGSVAIAGSLVQWFRDNIGLIAASSEIEDLAATVKDNGDVYFVPAFSGLYAPHWRGDARGVITGLTGFATKGHLARAVLEATAFQSWEIVKAMEEESGSSLEILKVDGGMTANRILMQFQSDILNRPVVRPIVAETTALGAAYAAGLSCGFWNSCNQIMERWLEDCRFVPMMSEPDRNALQNRWLSAVERSLGWV